MKDSKGGAALLETPSHCTLQEVKQGIAPGVYCTGERHCWHYIRAAGASQCCKCPAAYVRELGGVVTHPGRRALDRQAAERIVFLRRDGWSYQQIAELLGKTVGACRAMFCRATKRERVTVSLDAR